MIEERTRWHVVMDARVASLAEGALHRVLIKDLPVCFVRMSGRLHALSDVCPHQGKSISGGWCEDGHVVCPWHRMRFDPVTGRNRFGMTTDVQVYPVEEEGGEVRIGIPRMGFRIFGIRLW